MAQIGLGNQPDRVAFIANKRLMALRHRYAPPPLDRLARGRCNGQ
jgi:hypothetical protein